MQTRSAARDSIFHVQLVPPGEFRHNWELLQKVLITDVTITHPYTRTHEFKPNSLRDAEALKNRLHFSSYQTRGMALAPLACNSFGQQAPKMLRYQWIVADRTAQRVVSLPDFSLPAAADLPGVVDEHASLLQLYQRRSQRFFRQSVQENLGQCPLSPLLLPLASIPWGGASAVRTRYGRLPTAPRHLQVSAALCTGRGAYRRRPT